MAFNKGMTDSEFIEKLGGPTKVAELLKLEKHGGVQRVQNWITRGIPSRVKLDYPDIFLRDMETQKPAIPPQETPLAAIHLLSPQHALKTIPPRR